MKHLISRIWSWLLSWLDPTRFTYDQWVQLHFDGECWEGRPADIPEHMRAQYDELLERGERMIEEVERLCRKSKS